MVSDLFYSDPVAAGSWRGYAVGTVEMTADIARGDAELARRRDEDVGEVLADAAAQREGFRRGGRDLGRTCIEGDLAIDLVQQEVQQRQRVDALACAGARGLGKIGDRGVRLGERGFAQEQRRGK